MKFLINFNDAFVRCVILTVFIEKYLCSTEITMEGELFDISSTVGKWLADPDSGLLELSFCTHGSCFTELSQEGSSEFINEDIDNTIFSNYLDIASLKATSLVSKSFLRESLMARKAQFLVFRSAFFELIFQALFCHEEKKLFFNYLKMYLL